MHCMLIHQAFAGPGDPGGTRHFELAHLLAQKGHEFTVVTSTVNYLTGTKRELSPDLQATSGVRIRLAYTLPILHASFIRRVLAFVSFMVSSVMTAMRVGSVDLVMGTSPPLPQALSAWLVARLRRRPLVLEIRDLWPEFAIGMGVLTNPILIRLARWLESFLYRAADHIIVNSPAYRDYLQGRGLAGEKISLVSNGVDASMFDPAERGLRFRERLGIAEEVFVATYAGALGMANDISVILGAARELESKPEIQFVLIGDGKERAALQQISQDWGLTNVTFAGAVPKSEMPDVLAASDACVATLLDIPMFCTTYPNKVFDYMAAGRPTVLAIDGVIREVVEAADAGVFVPPGDSTALARAVCTLQEEPERARRMGTSARRYIEKNFDRRAQSELLGSILERVADRDRIR